jgi:hypothetical protein
MYSGGMPILNFVGVLYCIVAYWADKWCLLRGSQQPPSYNEDILKFCMAFLPLMAIFHTLTTCYVYGNQMLFPSEWRTFMGVRGFWFFLLNMDMESYDRWKSTYLEDENTDEWENYQKTRLGDFSRKATYLLLVVLLVGMAYYIVYYVYIFLLKPFVDPLKLVVLNFLRKKCGCFIKQTGSEDEAEPDYDQMVQESDAVGRLHSYAMQDNFKYQAAYQAIEGKLESDKHAAENIAAENTEAEEDVDPEKPKTKQEIARESAEQLEAKVEALSPRSKKRAEAERAAAAKRAAAPASDDRQPEGDLGGPKPLDEEEEMSSEAWPAAADVEETVDM